MRAGGRERGRFRDAMTADPRKNDLRGVRKPRRFLFENRRVEDDQLESEISADRKNRRLPRPAVDGCQKPQLRRRDSCCLQCLFGKPDRLVRRRTSLATHAKNEAADIPPVDGKCRRDDLCGLGVLLG